MEHDEKKLIEIESLCKIKDVRNIYMFAESGYLFPAGQEFLNDYCENLRHSGSFINNKSQEEFSNLNKNFDALYNFTSEQMAQNNIKNYWELKDKGQLAELKGLAKNFYNSYKYFISSIPPLLVKDTTIETPKKPDYTGMKSEFDGVRILKINDRVVTIKSETRYSYFCKVLYAEGVTVNTPLSWDEIYEVVWEKNFDYPDKELKRVWRKPLDLVKNLNTKIRKETKLNIDLFTWENKQIWRNF